MLYLPPSENEAKTLQDLLFQAERLQHDRIYYFLVSETIFFLAASTLKSGDKWTPVIFTCAGLLIALLFTFVNLKTYFRIVWLIRRLKDIDTTYKEYLQFDKLEDLIEFRHVSGPLAFYFCRIPLRKYEGSCFRPTKSDKTIKGTNTGILMTFWLGLIIIFTWAFFIDGKFDFYVLKHICAPLIRVCYFLFS